PPDARRGRRHVDRWRRRRDRALRGRQRATADPGLRAAGEDPRVSLEVRACRDLAEYGDALMGIGQYFGLEPDPEGAQRFAKLLPFDWMLAAWENGSAVGGAGAFPFDLSVPGGALPCAGTTVVGVAPTHRRRGVLRALMRAHIDDVHERGHPLAAL